MERRSILKAVTAIALATTSLTGPGSCNNASETPSHLVFVSSR